MSGHFEICKLIIENIEDKDTASNLGLTTLHFVSVLIAAAFCQLKICKFIIRNSSLKYIFLIGVVYFFLRHILTMGSHLDDALASHISSFDCCSFFNELCLKQLQLSETAWLQCKYYEYRVNKVTLSQGSLP